MEIKWGGEAHESLQPVTKYEANTQDGMKQTIQSSSLKNPNISIIENSFGYFPVTLIRMPSTSAPHTL